MVKRPGHAELERLRFMKDPQTGSNTSKAYYLVSFCHAPPLPRKVGVLVKQAMKFTNSIAVLGMDTTELIAALASGKLKPRANTETENGNENDPAPINLRLGSGGKDGKQS